MHGHHLRRLRQPDGVRQPPRNTMGSEGENKVTGDAGEDDMWSRGRGAGHHYVAGDQHHNS
eukprot:52065-Eustigmatos_ZCMA.PRE.1